jgi:hypothetical protein
MSGSITPKAYSPQKSYEALLFTTMDKKNWIRMKLRPSIDSMSFLSIKQIDLLITRIRTTITPQQIAFFMDLLDTMSTPNNPPERTLKKPTEERKIKVQMTQVELFIMADDMIKVEEKNRNHILFSIKQIHLRHQQHQRTTTDLFLLQDHKHNTISITLYFNSITE